MPADEADAKQATARRRRIIAYPRGTIAYTECFYAAMNARHARVIDGIWSGRWIIKNIRSGDVVHFHWPSFHYAPHHRIVLRILSLLRFAALLLIMRARGAQLVWTAHNLYPHDGGRGSRPHRFARWLVTRIATLVLVHSEAAAAIVSAEFGLKDARICRIQHGHFIDHYPHTVTHDEARKTLGIDAHRLVFGFVGTCKPYKDLEALIDAFAALNADATLLIAGAFQSEAYFAAIEKKLGSLPPDRVVFHPGFVPAAELQLYLQALDVMVIPYTEILTSGSAILALSFGKPVIAPNFPSLKEILPPDCGILYDVRDPGALARAMRSALSMQFDARRIIDRARRLDWRDSATRFLDALSARDRAPRSTAAVVRVT